MADKWSTLPQPTQAHAFLGVNSIIGHSFRFNPDTVQWSYQDNIISQDTLGGRVTQLLSVQLTGMTINGRAGNRGELQLFAKNIKKIMGYHVNTLEPVYFKVPSRNWNFRVYVQSAPTLGWDYASTSYPYSLVLRVEDDLTHVQTKKIEDRVLQNLVNGIGYNPDVHGGDAQHFYDIVKSVTTVQPGAATTDAVVGGDGGITPDGPTGQSGVPQTGVLNNSEMMKLTAWALSTYAKQLFTSQQEFIDQCIIGASIIRPESGGRTNLYVGGNCGLWQMTPGNVNNFSRKELMIADNNAKAMAEQVVANKNGCGEDNIPPSIPQHSWTIAWWCYWGAYREKHHERFIPTFQKIAERVNWDAYYGG